jgi:ADP-heptose:LPS heptosyltransferase
MGVKNPLIEALCALAALPLDRRVRSPEDLDREPPRRILLVRTDRIGDLLVCSPLVAALHQRWPEAELVLVGGRRNRAVMPLLPYLRRAPFEFDKHPLSWSRLVAWLPHQSFDLAVSLRAEVFSGAWIAAMSGARVRAVANVARTLPAFNLVLGPNDHHQLRRYWRAASRLGVTWPEPKPVVTVPEPAVRHAQQVIAGLALPPSQPLVGVGIPNRTTRRHAFKAWPQERLVELIGRLVERGVGVVLFGLGAERGEAERIAAQVPGVRIAPPLSLAQIAAVQQRLTLLVSSFTGTLHLADGVGTPTVAIGESRNAADWRPLGAQHRQIASPRPAGIPVDEVWAAVREALGPRLR